MALSSISITAPSSAKEGDQVSVSARVTNISPLPFNFRVKLYAVRDIYEGPAPGDLLGEFEELIGSGAYKTISGSFTMPSWDAIILVRVYRFIDYWDYDTHASKVVSLEIPVEVKMNFTVYLTNIFTGTTRWKCWFANKEGTISIGGMANVGEGILFSVDYDEGHIGVDLYDIDGKTIYSADTKTIFRPTNGATHYWDCLTHTIDGAVGEPSLIDPDLVSPYTPPEYIYVPEEEVEKKFPWTLVLIGGGAVIAIAGLAAARR